MRLDWIAAAAALLLATTAAAQQGSAPRVAFGIGLALHPDGLVIDTIVPGGTAAEIGLRAGDLVLQVGARAVTGPEIVSQYVQSLQVGDPVSVVVRRDGRTVELTGRAVPRPEGAAPLRGIQVQADELVETWNERVRGGSPVDRLEVDGWSLASSMPLARSEHAVGEMDGKVWVLGGYPPGRLPSNLVQVYDAATNLWSLGPTLPQPIHHMMVAAVEANST